MRSIFVSSWIDTRTKLKVASLLNENKWQIMKRDNCRISTWKDTTEEIRTKIKQKRPVCDTKSGKRKVFPPSLPERRNNFFENYPPPRFKLWALRSKTFDLPMSHRSLYVCFKNNFYIFLWFVYNTKCT